MGGDLERVEAAPRLADHADGARAPRLAGEPADHLDAVLLLARQVLVLEDPLGVARAAQVDPDRRVAVAGEVGVDPRVADGRRVVLAVRDVLEDRRHRILLGVLGQPDPRREADAVRHRDPDVVEPPDAAREVASELHTPAGMTVSVADTIGGITFDDPYRWLEEDTAETRSWQQRQDAAARETIGALPALERSPGGDASAGGTSPSSPFPRSTGSAGFSSSPASRGPGPSLRSAPTIGRPRPDDRRPEHLARHRGVARLVLSGAGRRPRRLRAVAARRRAERPPRPRGRVRTPPSRPHRARVLRRRRLAPRLELVLLQRRARPRHRAAAEAHLPPPARRRAAGAARAGPGAGGRGIRLPAGVARRALGDRRLERGRASPGLDQGRRGRRMAPVPARAPGHVRRVLPRRSLRRGHHRRRAARAARVDPAREPARALDLARARPARETACCGAPASSATGSRSSTSSTPARGSGCTPSTGSSRTRCPCPGEGTVGTSLPALPGDDRADGLGRRRRAPLRLLDLLAPAVPSTGTPSPSGGSRSSARPPRSSRASSRELRRCRSADGADVSYWLVRSTEADRAGPGRRSSTATAAGTSRGGFPTYLGELAPFVEAGGALVFPHLRGGSELGETQWHDGRLERKQHTFDDLYAVAEALVADGVTASDRLGLVGESNGGLLAGAALTQRPDLFRVVVPLVPLLDLMRHARDPYLGRVRDRVRRPGGSGARSRPARLLPVPQRPRGRALPGHARRLRRLRHPLPAPGTGRKLVARLQEANASGHPVLLRVLEHAGHLSTTERSTPEWLAFVMAELGMAFP